MSGPYCKTCIHFYTPPMAPLGDGECCDPAKIIQDRSGNRWMGRADVHESCTCMNHTSPPDSGETKP